MSKYSQNYQAFIADPSKSQVTTAMTGTKIFGKNSGDVIISGWDAIKVTPSVDTQYYFNGESTKYCTISSGVETVIFCFQSNVESVTFAFGAGTAEVQGM